MNDFIMETLGENILLLLAGCLLLGIPVGIQLGAFLAAKDQKSFSAGRILGLVCCVIPALIGFGMVALNGIMLLITFQWGYILLSLALGALACWLSFLSTKHTIINGRRAKYMRNPIMKKAVEFCLQHDVVGIQCFADGLRFFTRLEHPDYCKDDTYVHTVGNLTASLAFQKSWMPPQSWQSYDHSAYCAGTMRFDQYEYANVPDLPMFASALARKLGDFDFAHHKHSVQYITVEKTTTNIIRTYHVTPLREECFVYSRKAVAAIQKAQTPPAPKVPQLKKTNTWE